MARWHKPDCSAPNIVVDTINQTPSCLTCGTTPNLDELIRLHAHESPFPAPPPDQPPGKMNLWWPPSVPYLATPASAASDAGSDQPDPNIPAPKSPTPKPARQPSPIYPTPLKQGELRLACLTAPLPSPQTTKADYPVHLTLETYPLSNCPPYETVSYCWAGEDGDSTRRHPVYVGEYWDVMLHTENCWGLLRFVRPGRGVRLVWVDAVCIDQECDEEKAEQVAQMGRIYTMCTQVVVYLGPDVAPLLPEGRYPRRARLQDFESKDVPDIGNVRAVKELLQRRYFSRLWVIQELILSPRVVIRIGDIDFLSDGTTMGNLWKHELRHLAPWVQHTSNGAPLDLDMVQVMWLTFSSACADPRDRLFGIMGILSDESWVLPPDYSLSLRDVFIGLFAYLIIVKGMSKRLLTLGSGASGPSSVPSWVPSLTSWDKWRAVFDSTVAPPNVFPNMGLWVRADCGHPPHDFAFMLPRHHYIEGRAHVQEAAFHVHSTTGGLGAKMVRLLALTSVPQIVGRLKRDVSTLFVARRPGFCILRTVDSTEGNTKRLVATCEDVYFCFPPSDESVDNDEWDGVLTSTRLILERPSSRPDKGVFDGHSNIVVGDLYWTLSHVLELVEQWLNTKLHRGDEDLFFPPKFALKRRDILPVYLAVLQAPDGDCGGFLDKYERYIRDECGAEWGPDLWIFKVPYFAFETLRMEYERRGYSWVKFEGPARDPTTGQPQTGRVIVSCSEVSSRLVKLHDSPLAMMARAAVRRMGESLEQLLSRSLSEEEAALKIPPCRRTEKLLADGVGDGPVEHVYIV